MMPKNNPSNYGSQNGKSQWESYGVEPGSKSRNSKNTTNNNDEEDVCRDYMRNVCMRGNRCKFKHPSGDVDLASSSKQDTFNFCHDYQNTDCSRPNCKFIHCTREEEAEYRNSGYLPPHLRDQILNKSIAPDFPIHFGEIPICKDFMMGECSRYNCKYRHITRREYDLEMCQYSEPERFRGPYPPMFERSSRFSQSKSGQHRGGSGSRSLKRPLSNWEDFGEDQEHQQPPGKRFEEEQQQHHGGEGAQSLSQAQATTLSVNNEVEMLRQQNLILTQRLEELKKQVQNLTTTNEFLLEQNAQLRLGVKATTTVVNAAHPSMSVPSASGAAAVVSIQPTVSMSVQPLQPSISLSEPPTAMSVPIAVASMAEPTITMAALDQSGGIASVPGVQEIRAHVAPQPPPNGGSAVHVQETRIVQYPITSMRQTL